MPRRPPPGAGRRSSDRDPTPRRERPAAGRGVLDLSHAARTVGAARGGPGQRGEQPATPPSSQRASCVQIHACAALCALGGTVGLLYLLGELSHHLASARAAVGFVGAASAIGVVIGLLVPRLVIQRRMRKEEDFLDGAESRVASEGARVSAAPTIELGFAASLTGVLILVLAVLWTLMVSLTAHLDGYEAWLKERFLHPDWLTLLVLKAPFALGLILVSGASSIILVALHGWHRLVYRVQTQSTGVFIGALTAALLGAAVALLGARPPILPLTCLVTGYAAAIVAVIRKPRGAGGPAEEQRTSRRARTLSGPLLQAALAAASAGAVLGTALPPDELTPRAAASGWLALSGAGLVGLLLARAAVRRWPAAGSTSVWLVLLPPLAWAGTALAASGAGGEPANWCLAAVTCAAALSVALAGHRAGVMLGRPPPAIAWVGAAAAAGYGVGLVAAVSLC